MIVRSYRLKTLLRSFIEHHHHLVLVLFGAVLTLILTLIFTWRSAINQDIMVGRPSPRTINADRDLTFESPLLTEAKRREAANDPRNLVYNEDTQIHGQQREQLQATFSVINSVRENPSLNLDQQRGQLTELPSLPLSDTLAITILEADDDTWQRIKDQTNALYDRTLRENNYSIDETTLADIKVRYLPYNLPSSLKQDQRAVVLYLVEQTLHVNRTLNQEETERRQQTARNAVQSVSKDVVNGQNIVRQGDTVSAEQYETLIKMGMITPELGLDGFMGRLLLAILVALALCMALYIDQHKLLTWPRALLVILILMVIPILFGRIFLNTWLNFPETFALAVIAIPLAALFNNNLALVISALVSIVMMFLGEGALQVGMISFAGALCGIYAIRRADRAMAFIMAGVWIALGVFATAMIWRLIEPQGVTWQQTMFTLIFSMLNGGITAMMSLTLHNVLGRIAGIVTPMQLLELAHPNQPLLRRLMQEAPGTYHHSVVVSNLAEQAAERIGADTLLTRVGAYYHDIGKMLRPFFFTDNQYDRSNVHDNLDPQTSAKLIADHVIEGAKIARQHKIPEQIVNFIVEHHGTDVIRYFYQQALQAQDSVDINDYRYPGPKPQSKETAILMLADGVEATVRSKEQSGMLVAERHDDDDQQAPKGCQSIAQVVNQSIDMRLASGQLDQCPLTQKDLNTIRQSFVKTLQGIYHPRVEYPKLMREPQNK